MYISTTLINFQYLVILDYSSQVLLSKLDFIVTYKMPVATFRVLYENCVSHIFHNMIPIKALLGN